MAGPGECRNACRYSKLAGINSVNASFHGQRHRLGKTGASEHDDGRCTIEQPVSSVSPESAL